MVNVDEANAQTAQTENTAQQKNDSPLLDATAQIPIQVISARSEATKAGIAKARAAGTYKGGRPKKCLTCGYCHKVGKPCKDLNVIATNAVAPKVDNTGSVPPVSQP